MAFVSPHITSIAVQATEFYDLARKYRVTGVPKTVVNETIEILGALPEPEFVRAVLGIEEEPEERVEERSAGTPEAEPAEKHDHEAH